MAGFRVLRRQLLRLLAFIVISLLVVAIGSKGRPGSLWQSSSEDLVAIYELRFSLPRLGETFVESLHGAAQKQAPAPEPEDASDDSLSIQDEDLLPPLVDRPPIYCYYEKTVGRSVDETDAEGALLLTWRRAWWAQGFRPTILRASDAKENRQYESLQKLQLVPELEEDAMRWLAWDTRGGGILTHYTLVPMAPRDHPMLQSLRNGEFRRLTRWKGLRDALLVGDGADIRNAVESMTNPASVHSGVDVAADIIQGLILVDEDSPGVASYHLENVDKHFASVGRVIHERPGAGLASLNQLINAHLHNWWQNQFSEGIEVLKPFPEHATAALSNTLSLANTLAACADSPLPASCPPNTISCTPCVARSPMLVTTPKWYRDSKKVYSIGTVPHPWTLAVLNNAGKTLDIAWIRKSKRDQWLNAITQLVLGGGKTGAFRVGRLEGIISQDARSLWLNAESEPPTDVDWHLGFGIPTQVLDDGKSRSPIPADYLVKDLEKAKKPDRLNGPHADEDVVEKERGVLVDAARVVRLGEATPEMKLRKSLEAWNMADTEAWRFVRAFQARRQRERRLWEKEEGQGSETRAQEVGGKTD